MQRHSCEAVGPLLLLLLAAVSVTSSFHSPGSAGSAVAGGRAPRSAPEDVWRAFRAAHPFHAQLVGATRPDAGGARILVLSEPPPHVSLSSLAELDPVFASARTFEHAMGYDGWVKDVVVELPSMSETDFRELLAQTHIHLFHSAYKAWTLDLSAPARRLAAADFDVRFTPAELEQWLAARTGRFRPLLGGEEVELADLQRVERPGVWLSAEPGLVAWAFPRETAIDDQLSEIRQFCVDADLVLGAITDGIALVVLGRERTAPLDVLPPLRSETIRQLATIGASGLYQSYERNYFFAGKLPDGKDWAPIFLSDVLVDTELGSLLDLTDQILKSWTQHAETRYERFDYPDPPEFPFPGPLSRVLPANSVLFNWNTECAAYETPVGARSAVLPCRTGALGVTYMRDADEESDEEMTPLPEEAAQGYEYFAKAQDPNLARVVQYTVLFQAFQEARADAETDDLVVARVTRPDLVPEIEATLVALRDATPEERRAAAERFVKKTSDAPAEIEEIRAGIEASLQSLAEFLQEACVEDSLVLRRVAMRIGDPRSEEMPAEGLPEEERFAQALLDAFIVATVSEASPLFREFTNLTQMRDLFVQRSSRETDGWVRTPSIVVSWNVGATVMATGGHNIDAAVSRVRANPRVKPGRLRARRAENGIELSVHPSEAGRAPELIARAKAAPPDANLTPILRQFLRTTPPRPPQPLRSALRLREVTPETRGLAPDLVPSGASSSWRPAIDALSDGDVGLARAASFAERGSAVVQRTDAGFYRVFDAEGRHARAASMGEVHDIVESIARARGVKRTDLRLVLDGFRANEGEAFVTSLGSRRISASLVVSERKTARAFFEWVADFDVARASVRELEAGALEITIPARAGEASLGMRVRLLFSNLVPRSAIDALTASFSGLVRKLIGSSTSTARFGEDLLRALRDSLRVPGLPGDAIWIRIEDVSAGVDFLIVRGDAGAQRKVA